MVYNFWFANDLASWFIEDGISKYRNVWKLIHYPYHKILQQIWFYGVKTKIAFKPNQLTIEISFYLQLV